MKMEEELSSEDILSTSLESLYSYAPISLSGDKFTHKASGLTFVPPDTLASNWGLHASSIWIASIFLANHINDIKFPSSTPINVLELGAASGMPGILLSQRMGGKANVTLSDYPDDTILDCLKANIKTNKICPSSLKVVGHAWGEDTNLLGKFDTIIAADTLWNPDQHIPFCETLSRTLTRSVEARVYLVAGLHTGRWTIQRFSEKVQQFGLTIESMKERKVDGTFDSDEVSYGSEERDWTAERDGEDDGQRRSWVVWIVLKWAQIL